ncbi:hypothetical protein Kpol_1032p28 [Vanderwaltozyma polyspora DSM 70294]|uniref:Ubiquitin carboxyl-terminal hydrolase 4 n=1 Tax=Vanderwaltozyma polyspora (strain ATCC 22028 / DSM 70294 / BCRC 21397 / CBS 2163 / NBRC 10782 / NRRL Y-8283 / UCD 57-17) TaxID=436907 RepID=UBP4_VANPO|nr:uncharacterized protein Kpol_1032p28 [Vanderwaltozyma polyspora DSM 70294]A7TGY3.1 RecName: Full=Ubiquitin carboxyl-terminal hydrolase 4; AltName: Full=Deubiquitinating enzyme 4; AltName: Full=Ubiquitin thioesterase 4; AltName: Full=Ubiquitin-specific-processing protease 4 [Vanderwaltozyma polyspora DSM 70294]EDO18435.1 hypothetical protein Kpol_1032p28 [Vanderwaltozyma polyspora DSM 70294]
MVEVDSRKQLLYDPIVRLSGIADKFVMQDATSSNMKVSLQECIDTLANYQDECKKLKRNEPTLSPSERYSIYESAYIYYKIIHIMVLTRIPSLPQFSSAKSSDATNEDKELMQIYNMLVKTLLSDEKIAQIKSYLRANYPDKNSKGKESIVNKQLLNNEVFMLPLSGSPISAVQLNHLIQMYDSSLLLIDVRPRAEFDSKHIKAKSVICVEPVSFKNSFTDLEVEKKSLITSPQKEIALFQARDKYNYIVIYTQQSEKTQFYMHQQLVLLDILMNKSFAKPLNEKNIKVFTLDKGFSGWVSKKGACETTTQNGDAIYISGNTSSLNLQNLPQLSPNIGSSMDKSMRDMMSTSADFEGRTYQLPQQQQPVFARTPSFKNLFNKAKSSSTSSVTSSSPAPSQLVRPQTSSMPPLEQNFTQYPETPKLLTQINTNTMPLSQISPISSRAMSPMTKNMLTQSPQLPMKISRTTIGNGAMLDLKPHPDSKPPGQPVPALPQLPHHMTGTYQNLNQPKLDLDFTVGLENMGNSCYMNCIIQCLLSTHELSQIFLNNSYEKHINLNSKLGSKGVLAKYFARLVHTMYREGSFKRPLEKNKPIQPIQFKMACGSINSLFKDNTQQDSQEFCQFLLDGLHEDLNQCGANPPLKELSEDAEKMREKLSMRIASSIEWERFLTTDFSVIVDLFQGQYASQLKCKVCGCTSTTYQTFSVLSVPVPHVSSCHILDCFNEFTKVEKLGTDELWSCPTCKKKQPSTKKLTITRLPRNLIIHLKRFDNMMNKNNVFVKYPFLLDLTPYWANDFDGRLPPGVTDELPTRGQVPPFRYKLNAVASHVGSLYGGHYTAYVNKGINRGWHYFDDTSYRPIKNETECITPNAYVLFYHRVYGV